MKRNPIPVIVCHTDVGRPHLHEILAFGYLDLRLLVPHAVNMKP